MRTSFTLAISFGNLAEIIDSLRKDNMIQLDIGDVGKLTVNDLIQYLRKYPDEATYFNVNIDETILQYILEMFGIE